jgi:hypothetical protein
MIPMIQDVPGQTLRKAARHWKRRPPLEIARHTLLSCGLILALGTVAGLLAQKIRTPDVAVLPGS